MADQNLRDDVGGEGFVPTHTKDIINGLVESYKEQKKSAQDLFKDPLFLSLPATKQIEVIQAYSNVISNSSVPPSRSGILLRSIRAGATTGAIAGLAPALLMKSLPGRMSMLGGLTLAGATIGAVSGTLGYKGEKNRYETTNKYLMRLSKNKDTNTAFKVLDVNRKYEPRTLNMIISKLESPEKAIIEKAVGIASPGARLRMIKDKGENF